MSLLRAGHEADRFQVTAAMWGWVGLAAVAILAVVAMPLGPSQWVTTGMAVVTVIVVALNAIFSPLYARAAWRVFGVGMFLWVGSQLTLSVERSSLGDIQGVSVTYVLRLVGYVGLIAGALLMVRRRHTARDSTNVTDSLIALVAGAAVLAWTTLDAAVANESLSPASVYVLAGYGILDLLLLAVVVRLWFASASSTNRGIRLVSLAIFWLLVADIGVQYAVATGGRGTPPPEWVEVPYVAFFALAGLAALDPDSRRTPEGESDPTDIHRSRILALVIVSMLVPVTALVLFSPGWEGMETLVVLGLAGLLTVLLALRLSLLLLDFHDSVVRTRTLAQASEAISDAETQVDVDAMVPVWVTALGDSSRVGMLTGLVREASDTPAQEVRVGATGKHRSFRLTRTPDSFESEFSIGNSGRVLAVTSRKPLEEGLKASLATLAEAAANAYHRLSLQQLLVEQATRHRTSELLQQALDVVTLVSGSGAVEYATPALRNLTGLEPSAVVGMPWRALFHDRAAADAALEEARTAGAAATPLSTGTEEGHVRHVDVKVRWLTDDGQFVVTHHDITERQQLENALRRQAFQDPLTGLANRLVFREQLGRSLSHARRVNLQFAVLMIDLDEFKSINDSFGHPAGDELLRTVADRIAKCLRDGDTAARLGGDEFAVILENTRSRSDAEVVAQRIIDAIGQPITLADTAVRVGASIGIAVGDGDTDDADALARHADLALYRAKYGGKGRYVTYEVAMSSDAGERLRLTKELREAIDDGSMGVSYRPIVAVGGQRVCGFDASPRWDHPTRGLVEPDHFLHIAESSGLIVRLGTAVMSMAFAQIAQWRDDLAHGLRISVPVTARQFLRPSFADDVTNLVNQSGLSPDAVVLQVPEAVLLPGDERTRAATSRLNDVGIAVYVDEWGLGWSRDTRLDTLGVTGLRLSPRVVRAIDDPDRAAVAQSGLSLAASLGFGPVIAAGVDDEEMLERMQAMGFQLAEGKAAGGPLPVGGAEALLESRGGGHWPAFQADTPEPFPG